MLKFAAWLAIGFGIFLGVGEAVRNAEKLQHWPFWVVDYIAVALLLWGGVTVLRGSGARAWARLASGWGFATAMFYMSFFGHLAEMNDAAAIARTNAESAINEPMLTIIIGAMFAVTVLGLLTTLSSRTNA